MLSRCKLCGKKKPLIRAHIIPRFLYAHNSVLISDDTSFIKRCPKGIYDKTILCGKCDNKLGRLDDFAKRTLVDHSGVISEVLHNHLPPYQPAWIYRLKDKAGYDKINRFFISVLWRASISSRKEFAEFTLAEYEETAKKTILDHTYDYSTIFSIALCRLTDIETPHHLFSSEFQTINNVKYYISIFGYHKIIIKCWEGKLSPSMSSDIVSPVNDMLMIEGKFSSLPEYQMLHDMWCTTDKAKASRQGVLA